MAQTIKYRESLSSGKMQDNESVCGHGNHENAAETRLKKPASLTLSRAFSHRETSLRHSPKSRSIPPLTSVFADCGGYDGTLKNHADPRAGSGTRARVDSARGRAWHPAGQAKHASARGPGPRSGQGQGRSFDDVPFDDLVAFLHDRRTTDRNDYLATLARWREFYPDDRFLIAFYEDVSERPRELLARVFRHLGVSADVDWSLFPYAKVIHGGAKLPMPDSIREMLTHEYRDAIRQLTNEFDAAKRWL